jgi:hypothetical protein
MGASRCEGEHNRFLPWRLAVYKALSALLSSSCRQSASLGYNAIPMLTVIDKLSMSNLFFSIDFRILSASWDAFSEPVFDMTIENSSPP